MSSFATSQPQWVTSTTRIYRHYLYLDAAEILNALAGLEGGEEQDRVRTTVKELGGNIGAKFAFAGVDVSLGGKGRKQLQEELKLKQTIHGAAGSLISKLTKEKAVAEIRSSDFDKVWENLLVKFDADLVPLSRAREPRHETWWDKVRPGDAAERAAEDRAYELGGWTVVAYADVKAAEKPPRRVALELQATYLTPDYGDEFCRRATILGQVIYVARENERLTTRVLGNDLGERLGIEDTTTPGGSERAVVPMAASVKEVTASDGGEKRGWLRRLFGRQKPANDAPTESRIRSAEPTTVRSDQAGPMSAPPRADIQSPQRPSAGAFDESPAEPTDGAPTLVEDVPLREHGASESHRPGRRTETADSQEVVRVAVKPLCIWK